MISVLCTFLFCIFNVQKTLSVRIFQNTIPVPSSIFTRFEPSVISKTCLLVPERGPCRSKISMWYYDPAKTNCSQFNWGGCQGNGNRFDSFPDCWGYCMSKPGSKNRPRYCSLTFDYGFCFGAVERWYYDAQWKVCKTTLYSGCGGNKNNFYNQEQCEHICRFGKTLSTRRINYDNSTRKVLIINPWNTTGKRGLVQPTTAQPEASNTTTQT